MKAANYLVLVDANLASTSTKMIQVTNSLNDSDSRYIKSLLEIQYLPCRGFVTKAGLFFASSVYELKGLR